MRHALALLAPLLGLGLGLALSRLAAGATDCKFLGPAEHLIFTPAARARWLAPRVRAPGLLDSLYGTVRRFLSVVQLNPFPSELVKALLNELASVKVNEAEARVGQWGSGRPSCPATCPGGAVPGGLRGVRRDRGPLPAAGAHCRALLLLLPLPPALRGTS
ncbi:PROM2 isoform 6 [Pongo abelii]|uniref:PROM2 isoform 6 n=1 Tax=Pongo abelii TaxID=9601 RepID=A0A2J8R398_PONAB|nr:PROM2 isoform 6 [Pongo abelii]